MMDLKHGVRTLADAGFEIAPDKSEALFREWIRKCRKRIPKSKTMNDTEIFNAMMVAFKRYMEETGA